MMLRCILPVGQGAFYLERFKSNKDIINVVYDCGSLTDVNIVEKEIRSNFHKGDEIETVFISHIDYDHINGLEYLLKYCKVKNIVFPYTKREDKITLAIDYFCKNNNASDNDFTYKFINDPHHTIRDLNSDTILYGIREYHSDNDSSWTNDNEYEEEFKIINSGFNLFEVFLFSKNISNINWEYVPFNFREDKRKKQFFDELNNNLKKLGLSFHQIGIDKILQKWADPDIQNAIIEAYKKVKGNLNTNSMVLFSGIRDNNVNQWRMNPYNNCHCSYCFHKYINHFYYDFKKNGCLYTGDYEAKGKQKWNELRKAYSKYWDYIGCVQIPHHGSYRNYNHEFALLDAYFIISVGCKNKYRHPSGSVIKDLYLNKKYTLIVTEHRNSEIILEIDI